MWEEGPLKNYKPITIDFCMSMDRKETTIDNFYEFIYDNKKQTAWMSIFPFVWFTAEGDYFKVGSSLTFKTSLIPFFSYHITCAEVLPNKGGFLVEVSGRLKGNGKVKLKETKNGLTYSMELNVTGVNSYWHNAYKLVKYGHNLHMILTERVLRKMVIKNLKAK